MKVLTGAALAAAILAAVALAGVARPEGARGDTPEGAAAKKTITVTGDGKVETVPDEAQLSLGVRTSGETAAEAMEENAQRMARVVRALRGAGVDEKDIRTEEISLSPRLKRNEGVIGYVAVSTVSASSGLKQLSEALDAAVEAGANQSYGLSLSRSDREQLYRAALKDAVADARAKAQALAAAGGFAVGAVVTVDESAGSDPVYYDRAVAAEAAPAMDIAPGTQEVHANVRITFAIA